MYICTHGEGFPQHHYCMGKYGGFISSRRPVVQLVLITNKVHEQVTQVTLQVRRFPAMNRKSDGGVTSSCSSCADGDSFFCLLLYFYLLTGADVCLTFFFWGHLK